MRECGLAPQLERFLADGPAPLVYVGSAAVLAAGDFYEQSARVAMQLGSRRCC